MRKVIVVMGRMGCGKSTAVRGFERQEGGRVIEMDEVVRESLWGNGPISQRARDKAWAMFRAKNIKPQRVKTKKPVKTNKLRLLKLQATLRSRFFNDKVFHKLFYHSVAKEVQAHTKNRLNSFFNCTQPVVAAEMASLKGLGALQSLAHLAKRHNRSVELLILDQSQQVLNKRLKGNTFSSALYKQFLKRYKFQLSSGQLRSVAEKFIDKKNITTLFAPSRQDVIECIKALGSKDD